MNASKKHWKSDAYETAPRNRLHGLLSTLLSEKLTPKEKENRLSTDFDFETSTELEGGLREMCNLSDLVEERGIEKGRLEGCLEGREKTLTSQIRKKLAKGKSLAQIADELEETVEAIQPLYEQVLKEMN